MNLGTAALEVRCAFGWRDCDSSRSTVTREAVLKRAHRQPTPSDREFGDVRSIAAGPLRWETLQGVRNYRGGFNGQ